ncbi:hypothetical protein HanIR_Chr04g0177421 [Helianthus annuus]|nr:hypothetical protein HanIR_Chr04g0177421 [Helianthus annuus]
MFHAYQPGNSGKSGFSFEKFYPSLTVLGDFEFLFINGGKFVSSIVKPEFSDFISTIGSSSFDEPESLLECGLSDFIESDSSPTCGSFVSKKQIHCHKLLPSSLSPLLSSDLHLMNSSCLALQTMGLIHQHSYSICRVNSRTKSSPDILWPSSSSFAVCLFALVKASLSFLEL